jgi:threonine/homoserine/homoserine lactone efflux protein
MPHFSTLIAFGLISLGMALTPGPNMIYSISRSITQGRNAGLISLGGVALGFVLYMLAAAFGLTALLFAVPYAYDALRLYYIKSKKRVGVVIRMPGFVADR